jgi:methionyl-tRNA formyltransferase
MRVVFITHNEVGQACLEELVDLGADVRAVYTRPERSGIVDQVDLEGFTAQHGIPLERVDTVNTDEVKAQIAAQKPDLLFAVGWSRLVDTEVVDLADTAALGMHPAPLPRGRGRAPLAWSLIKGLDETALSMFHLVEEADAGDLVGQQPIAIDDTDDATSLYGKVVDAARRLIRRYYPEFEAGDAPRTSQGDAEATWWPKREPHHGLIDWTRPPDEVYDWIRGQTRPYPGAYSRLDGRRVTVWAANPPGETTAFVRPGEVVYRDGDALGVGAWEGVVELTEVQVDDDDPIPGGALLDQYDVNEGDTFDNARDLLG